MTALLPAPLPSGSHLTPAGQMTSQLSPQTPASLRTFNSPTPSPPQAPASPSIPAAPQPTVTVLGKGAVAISAKGAAGARDNPLLSTCMHHSRRHHRSRRSRSSTSSSSSTRYRSRSRRRHSSSSSDSTSSDSRSHRRRHHHYYTSSSNSSPSRHLSGVSCAPPVPRKLVHRIRRGKYVNFDKLLTPPDTPPFAIPTRHKKTTPPVQRTLPSYRPGFVVGGLESVFVHSPFIPARSPSRRHAQESMQLRIR